MAIIKHKLDLVIRLIDATTGRPVDERNTSFSRDGKSFRFMEKGGGVYFLINGGRDNFELSLNVYGYEAKKVMIDFDELDDNLPEKLIWLIPKNALSLEGTLKGITSLCAVRLATPVCFVNGYDAKKNVVTLFNPHNLMMRHHEYGILDQERSCFEAIYLKDEDGVKTITPTESLKKIPGCNDPIERLIRGDVTEDGRYVLRMRDDADKIEVLVRFVVENREFFQKVEFHNLKENELDMKNAYEVCSEKETEVNKD